MKRQVLVSGIQPSGKLHIGNYLGALKNFVELQNSGKYDCFFFIADLHSITESFDPKKKQKQILELAADFLAAGLNPKKSTLFLQSLVPAHTELAWIFNTITPMGELERMTQYKDKSAKAEIVNAGLFTYPTLMAADILLYNPAAVPVGDDQLQHLELARTIVRKFNGRFGRIFTEPKGILTHTPRVMSLRDSSRKMSKSDPASCLFLDDSPEEIHDKVKRAVTDSGSEIKYDPKEKPGVSNLLGIYSAVTGRPMRDVEKEFAGNTYSHLKERVAFALAEHFREYRNKKAGLMVKSAALKSLLVSGSKKASKVAEKTLFAAKKKVGLSP
ncbi:MAG: tryptophan--tRNA ligase [Patescibacteria group bacterium]